MGMLKIRCGYCGQSWEIYSRSDWHRHANRTCPHCDSKIDGKTWENKVLPAYIAMCEANAELLHDHAEYGQPIFSIDYVEDHYFPNTAASIHADIEALSEKIDDVAEALQDLTLYQ